MPEVRKYFSKLGFFYLIGTVLIIGIQYFAAWLLGRLNPVWAKNENVSLLVTMLSMYLIAAPITMKLIGTIRTDHIPVKRKMTAGQWIIAFFMCYAGMYLCNIFGILFTTVVGMIKQSPVPNVMQEVVFGIHPAVSFLLMVLFAPVVEEILFRKLLVDRTVKYGEGVAVLVSGLMFGLFHGNLNQFVYAFFIGSFFAFLYVKTGEIRYTILMHMLINFLGSEVSVLLLKISGYENFASGALPDGFTAAQFLGMLVFLIYVMMLIAFTITGVVLFVVNRKKFVLCPGAVTIEKGQRFQTVFMNLGMGAFCLAWIVWILFQLLG